VTYYTRRPINQIGRFVGLNGTFPQGMAPFITATNKWLAIDQNTEKTKDTNGAIWTKVTRKMEAAPGALNWNPANSIYGEWTW
jgi:hypothetical protein